MKGPVLSNYDGDIRAAAAGSVVLEDLVLALGRGRAIAVDRHDAMACYLSGGEGWRDARAALGGTFAKGATRSVSASAARCSPPS